MFWAYFLLKCYVNKGNKRLNLTLKTTRGVFSNYWILVCPAVCELYVCKSTQPIPIFHNFWPTKSVRENKYFSLDLKKNYWDNLVPIFWFSVKYCNYFVNTLTYSLYLNRPFYSVKKNNIKLGKQLKKHATLTKIIAMQSSAILFHNIC